MEARIYRGWRAQEPGGHLALAEIRGCACCTVVNRVVRSLGMDLNRSSHILAMGLLHTLKNPS